MSPIIAPATHSIVPFIESPVVVHSGRVPDPQPNEVNALLFHRDCMDGMAAAWGASKLLGNRAKYFPMTYGDPAPDVTGMNVAAVDLSLPPDVVEVMMGSARSFVLLDHHDSSLELLRGMPNVVVDLGRSGARLSWAFFHPGKPVPDLVRYADDYDRYRFELPDSRAYNAYVKSRPFRLQEYDALSRLKTSTIIARGKPMWQIVETAARSQAATAVPRKLSGFNARVANVTAFVNETADALKVDPNCDIAALWHYDHGRKHFKISLRTAKEGVNVKDIAESFPGGGGGHKLAAGFRWAGSHIEDIFDKA